jgi:hypothetical protein
LSAGTVGSDVDPFGFYAEMAGALDANGSHETRLSHAAAAVSLKDSLMAKAMEG